jgi:hypothetical protein
MQILNHTSVADEPALFAGYGAASRRAILIGVGMLTVLAMVLVWVLSAVTGS